jgi:hypothetical protein
MISLLCPTRGRPEQCKRMIESVAKTASGNINIFVCIQEEEIEKYSFLKTERFVSFGKATVFPFLMLDAPTVHKWNELYLNAIRKYNNIKENADKLFMLAADDIIFDTPGWDKALIDHYNSLENKIHVYSLRDSRDPDGTPHPIFSREYIDALGYFLPPIFLHFYCDTWSVEVAKANNCFTHLKDYLLIHDKPSDTGKPDETHKRIRNMGWHARDEYVWNTCKRYMDMDKQRIAEALHPGGMGK